MNDLCQQNGLPNELVQQFRDSKPEPSSFKNHKDYQIAYDRWHSKIILAKRKYSGKGSIQ